MNAASLLRRYPPRLLLIPLAAGFLCLAVVYAFGSWAMARDVGPLRSAIAFAFQQGDLPDHAVSDPNRHFGSFTFNDCLILQMAVNTSGTLTQRVVSPAPIEKRSDPALKDTCQMLRELVVDGNVSDYASWPYHRYVSAFVPVTAALVPALGVATWKRLLELLNYAAVAAIGATAALRWSLRRRQGLPARPGDIVAMIASFVFVLFFGMEFYAQNLSIGLAELVVYGWFAALAFGRPLDWTPARLVAITSAAFTLITALEFWTGQIPMAAAIGVALIGVAMRDPSEVRLAIERALLMLVAAGATIVATFGLKIAAASIVFGENVLANFTGQLEVRVGDGQYGLGNLVLHLGGRADHIGQGSLTLGLVAGMLAVGAGLAGLVLLLRQRAPAGLDGLPLRTARAQATFLIVSALMIVAWHVLFRNHSSIHSEFMVRTFAWVWTCGSAVFALGWRAVRSRAASPSAEPWHRAGNPSTR